MNNWKKDAIMWAGTILIVAIVFSGFTSGCRETEETNRVRIQLDMEKEKTDQMRIEKGLPVAERTLTTEGDSVN